MKKFFFTLCCILSVFLISFAYKHYTVNDELLKITREYRNYTLYNSKDYWTIAYCEPYYGPGDRGDTLHMSTADVKKSPHGDKLYKLYVKDLAAYRNEFEKQPEGQVLIKEVWNVRRVSGDSVLHEQVVGKRSFNDGLFYASTIRKELYIMYKTTPSEENDEGWWYGIVNIEQGTEKATVIESMKINRCVKCHAENKHDRIFGSPE